MSELPTDELNAWLATRDAAITAEIAVLATRLTDEIAALTARVSELEASGPTTTQADFIGALAITGVPQELQDQLKEHIRNSIGA